MFISTSPSIIPSNRFDMLDPTDHNQLFNNTQFSIHEFEEQQDFESQQQQQPPQQQQQQQQFQEQESILKKMMIHCNNKCSRTSHCFNINNHL